MNGTEGNRRRVRGVVISDTNDKTVTVRLSRRFPHPKYGKMVRRDAKMHVHDERNEAHVGDTVEIVECRPMSRLKRWRLVRVLERNPELVAAEAVQAQQAAQAAEAPEAPEAPGEPQA